MNIEDFFSEKFDNIWIYGAGKIGKKLLGDFGILNVPISGIVMSRYDGTIIPGVNVTSLEQITSSNESTFFLITTSVQYHQDIISNLKEKGYYNYLVWEDQYICDIWSRVDYRFVDRRKGKDKCCLILAGYKDFLWDKVFERFSRFIPNDIDVCIMSSGIYREELEYISEQHGWSYISTYINSVTLIQNVALAVMKDYKWVYKIDEDIFITKNSFEIILEAYLSAEKESGYRPGFSAPLIPVNGYGYNKILLMNDIQDEYECQFGPIIIGGNPESEIEKNPESAVFMWDKCKQLDEMNAIFNRKEISVDCCSVRFSIGFILFEHKFWTEMNGFSVSGNADMGTDEEEICAYCINRSRPIVVSENTVVGHFSFGKQTERMKKYYTSHLDWFDIHN